MTVSINIPLKRLFATIRWFSGSIYTINIYCIVYGHLTRIYRKHTHFGANNLSKTSLTDSIKHFYRILKSEGHRYANQLEHRRYDKLCFLKLIIVQWVTLSYLVVPLFYR